MIIAGLGTAVAPAAFAALPAIEAPRKLLLSGRVLGSDGKPLFGAAVVSGQARAFTDADGRFMVLTSTPHYRVTYRARTTEGTVSNPRVDADGVQRVSVGLTLV